ncbi:MAG: carotenoid 1,2-hydratase, partial [Pseudomonadota bacterium]
MLVALLAGCGSDAEVGGNDFAILAQADEAYAQAQPGTVLSFPRDHGPHPDYRIEWWYLTANLVDESGRPWGVQWTLFRTAIRPPEREDAMATEAAVSPEVTPAINPATPPSTRPAMSPAVVGQGEDAAETDNPWQADQVYMAHFAVSSPDGHQAFQRYARGGNHQGVRQAGARAEPFAAWLDDWRLESTGPDWLPLRATAAQGDVRAELRLSSDRSLVLQGERGFSQKHPAGGGSYYYSHPWLEVAGT